MKITLPILAAASLLTGACGSEPRAQPRSFVQSPTIETPRALQPASASTRDDPNQSNVSISADIKRACGISDSDAFFPYNSANVQARDRAILKRLATCFTSGPLKGRKMHLVGHADPRGELEYNYLLGQRRADNVKSAIVGAGMASDKVGTTSRGEDEARGSNEASWARDRRVDVQLAN